MLFHHRADNVFENIARKIAENSALDLESSELESRATLDVLLFFKDRELLEILADGHPAYSYAEKGGDEGNNYRVESEVAPVVEFVAAFQTKELLHPLLHWYPHE